MDETAEQQRLDELFTFDVLDTPPEPQFDDLARLAAQFCGTPSALVSLVDADRLYLKSHVNLDFDQAPREGTFCDVVVRDDIDLLLVPDAHDDPRFCESPVVTGGPCVRFYAGVPLVSPSGHRLGALCVLDNKPHELTSGQTDALKALGRQVVSQLELRRGAKETARLFTEARHAERRARHEASHDNLTGLPNRASITQTITECLAGEGSASAFGVLFLDLDHFKVINDSLGHAAGDLLLNTVANRLTTMMEDVAIDESQYRVARFGGDEFVILLQGLPDLGVIDSIIQAAIANVCRPFQFGGTVVHPNVSVGVATGPGGYTSADELLRDADAALTQAKAAGRGQYVVFDARMHERAVLRLKLESELRQAVDLNELSLHYQPVVDLAGRRPVGVEALVRWRHNGKLVSPADFIPVAEETGLIVPIGRWVLTEAVRQAAEWRRRHPRLPRFKMAVNVSRRQLADADLVPLVQRLLAEHKLDPSTLMLEITESVVMNDANEAHRVLSELRSLGVRLAMDDFGTGYSSLSCLNNFDLDVLKVDRSFVANLGHHRESAVMRAVLELAHGLGMTVVAEGIETQQQLAFLAAAKCDYGQGYLFAKPLEAEAAEAFLTSPMPTAALSA